MGSLYLSHYEKHHSYFDYIISKQYLKVKIRNINKTSKI